MTAPLVSPLKNVVGKSGRSVLPPPAHPLENALLAVTACHLGLLPWALGTMHAWSQLASLGLSAIAFFLAVMPRAVSAHAGGTHRDFQQPVRRLRRFPVFWGGLLMLGYIAVQGLNPAWRFVRNADSWWLEPHAHVSWLPTGVAAPFDWSNPWRALVIYGALWLTVCAVWCGFQRRRSYRALFTLLAVNAFLLALLGLAQQLSGTDRIFWSYLPSNDKFIASFIYPNHAGAYFNLLVGLSAGLACWHFPRAQSRLESPVWTAGFAVAALFSSLLVIYSNSRGSLALLLVFGVFFAGALALRLGRRKQVQFEISLASPLLISLVLVGVLAATLVSLRADKLAARLGMLVDNPVATMQSRSLARQATTDLLKQRPLLGWGAGCFRHVFPLTLQHYPEIYYFSAGRLRYWAHAHCDLLQFPVELGLVGIFPLAVMLAWGARLLCRAKFWQHAVPLSLVLAGALLLLHAWVDFVFQNPAVLITAGVLFIAALRWTELDTRST